jgi:hypothetical protein
MASLGLLMEGCSRQCSSRAGQGVEALALALALALEEEAAEEL